MSRQGLVLDKVVLLGRTFEEYIRYFGLDAESLKGHRVLDVASGVSSFCAEANESGIRTTAVDPIYQLPADEILARCEPDLYAVTRNIALAQTYKWDFYKSPNGMQEFRRRAYQTFLADYRTHGENRYVGGSLPQLPFADQEFDTALVSYLLFVYDDHFDYAFHKESLLEIMRVTRGEARCYPIVTFEAQRSRHIDALQADPDLKHLAFEIVPSDFEFLIGSNYFLQIRRR